MKTAALTQSVMPLISHKCHYHESAVFMPRSHRIKQRRIAPHLTFLEESRNRY